MTQIVPNQKDIEASIQFDPGPKQREAKAQFWEAVRNSPVLQAEDMSESQIISITGKASWMREWLRHSEFRAWFFNQHHTKLKIMAAAEVAVDTLVEILGDDSPKSLGHRVRAAQTILHLAGMEPPKVKKVEFADKEVNDMNEEQLEQFLSNAKKRIIDSEKT